MEHNNDKDKPKWKKLMGILKTALWEGAIDFGKATPWAAGPLGFLSSFQKGLQDLAVEERKEMALELRRARPEDLAREFEALGIQSATNQEIMFAILACIARQPNMIEDAPILNDILVAVHGLYTLPDEILNPVRSYLREIKSQIADVPGETVKLLKREQETTAENETERFEKEYLKAINDRYGAVEILGMPYGKKYPISVGFVSLWLEGGGGEDERSRQAEQVLQEHKQLIIEGDAGAGKTTLLQWEAVQCFKMEEARARSLPSGMEEFSVREEVQSHKVEARCIPFLIHLRDLVRDAPSSNAFPDGDTWVRRSVPNLQASEPKDWRQALLDNGRAILMLDGLDEVPDNKRKEFYEGLQGLWKSYPKLRFRVSSRPISISGEGKNADGHAPLANPNIGEPVPVVKVRPLAREGIDQLIDRWHEAVVKAEPTQKLRDEAAVETDGYAERLKAKIHKPENVRMRELAETPLLCAAICLINRHERERLPRNPREVFRILIVAMVRERDWKKKVKVVPFYDELELDIMVSVHAFLAFQIMTSGKLIENGNADIRGEMSYRVEAYKKDVLGWLQTFIDGEAKLHRTADPNQLLRYMIDRCALVREPALGQIDFKHRALQDYLAGSWAMQEVQIQQLVNNVLDDRWRDTIILAAGGYSVHKKDTDELIRRLVDRGDNENQKKSRRLCYAIAGGCLGTAIEFSPETEALALESLKKIIPPQNSQEAKDLSAAGGAIVDELAYKKLDKRKKKAIAACAETLARIGSPKARDQLRDGYVKDMGVQVIRHVLRCPDIHPFECSLLTKDFGSSKTIRLSEFAVSFLNDLGLAKELEAREEIEAVELPDCPELSCIKGIEALKKVWSLNLQGCKKVGDLSPLKGLSELRRLNLTDCAEIEDLGALGKLSQLRELDLSRCVNVKSVEVLAGLENLEALSLRRCEKIEDIGALAHLKKLKSLDLGCCRADLALSALEALPALERLNVQGRKLGERDVELLKRIASGNRGGDYVETAAGLNMSMVRIAGGSFRMGSKKGDDDEKPVRPVTLSGFMIAATQVTQGQYEVVMGKNPSRFKGPENPVERVSWEEAMAFCEKLSAKAGRKYTLPGEAQWEFACRAGNESDYCFGDDQGRLGDYAWFGEDWEKGETHPAGWKRPNAWGLYDMHGNVWEWCLDHWHDNYEGAPNDGNAWVTEDGGSGRVIRGGCWFNGASNCRSACRYSGPPVYRYENLGFRVLADPAAGE